MSVGRFMTAFTVAGFAMACSGGVNSGTSRDSSSVTSSSEALTTEDGLADAYALFKSQFVGTLGFDKTFPIGYGYHPGLSSEKLTTGGSLPRGRRESRSRCRNAQGAITTNGLITATLEQVPSGINFDLWFVKNVAGSGRTGQTGDRRPVQEGRLLQRHIANWRQKHCPSW